MKSPLAHTCMDVLHNLLHAYTCGFRCWLEIFKRQMAGTAMVVLLLTTLTRPTPPFLSDARERFLRHFREIS
jgi:hypothetical protein